MTRDFNGAPAVQPVTAQTGADDATAAGRPRAAGLLNPHLLRIQLLPSRDSLQITRLSASGTARPHTNKKPDWRDIPYQISKELPTGGALVNRDNGTASAPCAHPAARRPCGR